MYQLVIKPKAIEMVIKAYYWYEEEQEGLGGVFLQELERCYDKIETFPAVYAKIKKNFRQIIMKKFPYVVVFEILENRVVVYAVFHTSRNPRKKYKK